MGKRIESPAFLVQQGRPASPANVHDKKKALGAAKQAIAKIKARIPRKRKGPPRRKTAGNVVAGQKLRPIVQDREYLDGLREEACLFTGLKASPDDPVEPMHVGNCGKNLKSDDETIPARHSIHDATHRRGITAVLPYLEANPDLLLALLRAYGREQYRMKKGLP